MSSDIKPGDWVRFYRGGVLVIGKVEYVTEDTVRGWLHWLCTDAGQVESAAVLELRPPPDKHPL